MFLQPTTRTAYPQPAINPLMRGAEVELDVVVDGRLSCDDTSDDTVIEACHMHGIDWSLA